MIPLNFGLWWSGAKLSYLRYLTFKSLRYFHPHSRIQLYTCKQFGSKGGMGKQEFEDPNSIKTDYTYKLGELGVEIVKTNSFAKYSPNHQSDMFRWQFLKDNGGFYLDTDQIILKSFESLPLKKDFIYSSYKVKSIYLPNGYFAPVGVLGASTKSKIVSSVLSQLSKYYNAGDYNSIGPWMFEDMEKKLDMKEGFNAPSSYFYPIPIGDQLVNLYNGSMKLSKGSFAIHWFGGVNESQDFNKKYTEEFAKKSNDSISVFLRRKRII